MTGARDPRNGLQRRYTMEEILELHGGRAKIQPLNYDALAVLRNPLYVKFAEELKDRNSEMNKGILAKQTEDAAVRQMASDNDLPHAPLQEVLQRAPADGKGDDDFPGGDDGGDGGDGGGGGGSASSGRNSRSAVLRIKAEDESERFKQRIASDLEWTEVKRGGGSSGSRPAGGSSPTASASNLQVMAQIEELRREMRQQQKQEIIVHNMPPAPTNPIKEIIREIHQVHVPQPAQQPQPQSEDTARLIAALSQAVAQNVTSLGSRRRWASAWINSWPC